MDVIEIAYTLFAGVLIITFMYLAYHRGYKDGRSEGYEDGYYQNCDPNERWL